MKYKFAVCLFLIAFLLQATLLNVIAIFGATPNLLLCLVVIFSFLYDEGYYGMILGVTFGLLYDICFSEYIGIAALCCFIIALSIMLVNVVMNKEMVLSVVLITIASTFLYNVIYWAIMEMLGSNYGFFYMLRCQPLYMAYNTVVTVILYYVLIKRVVRHHKDRYYR